MVRWSTFYGDPPWADPQANIITSIGTDATQTVFHTHLHVVPRSAGDGLHLPWTGQWEPVEVPATAAENGEQRC